MLEQIHHVADSVNVFILENSSCICNQIGIYLHLQMANWFKLYETDIDDERMQWAMSEQQQVFAVYVTIMSRCCRERSGTLAWTGKDWELMALANKVKISLPIANECLRLLQKIEFIEISENTLKLLNWNTRQSEYCQRKSKSVPIVSRHSPDTIGTKTEVSPLLSSPLISSKERGTWENQVGEMDKFKKRMLSIFKTSSKRGICWPYDVEQLAAEIISSQEWEAEFDSIERFMASDEEKLPESSEGLIRGWSRTLERSHRSKMKPQSEKSIMVKDLEAMKRSINGL